MTRMSQANAAQKLDFGRAMTDGFEALNGAGSEDKTALEAAIAPAADARIAVRQPAISRRTGWLHVFTDSAGSLLGGWKLDGSFLTALTGSIDAAITGLKASMTSLASTVAASVPATIAARAGWLHVFTDSAGNKLFGANTQGDFVIGRSTNLSQFFRDGAISPAIKAALYPNADISIYGDSETENALGWPAIAAAFTAAGETRDVFASGRGGQGSRSILARQGGMPALVTFPTSGTPAYPTIPADTAATAVTVTGAPLSYADPAQAKSMTGVLQSGATGIPGTLTRLAGTNNYTFSRAVAGTALQIDAAVPFIPDNDAQVRRLQLCWIGTNDLIPAATDAATIFSYIEAYIARQKTIEKRTVILMPVWDMSNPSFAARRAIYDSLLALVKAKYPHCYVDTVAVLQRAVAAPDANDTADIANGLIPRSIQSGDRLHFPAGGVAYQALATEIFNVIKRNGW